MSDLDWKRIQQRWDKKPPRNRSQLKATVFQREQWWHIRCWLKPRLLSAGATHDQWSRYKRILQKQLREEGFEPTVQHAERILHQIRTTKS